jgi:hypothetical protein
VAAYLVVNRLASKCIQRLDLKGIDPVLTSARLQAKSISDGNGDKFFAAWLFELRLLEA